MGFGYGHHTKGAEARRQTPGNGHSLIALGNYPDVTWIT